MTHKGFLLKLIITSFVQEIILLIIFERDAFHIEIIAESSQENEFIIHREGKYEEAFLEINL